MRTSAPDVQDDVLDLIGPVGPFMTLLDRAGADEKSVGSLTLTSLLVAIDEAEIRYHPNWIPGLSWVADQYLELHPEDRAVVNTHLIRAGIEESVTEESEQ